MRTRLYILKEYHIDIMNETLMNVREIIKTDEEFRKEKEEAIEKQKQEEKKLSKTPPTRRK